MINTKKIYDEDAYQTEFTATVRSCEPVIQHAETRYEVVLDQTLFFPEEGGQSPDKGTLEDISVIDVQIKEGIIYHVLEQPIMVGAEVCGRIDWKHRFSNMQQHTGEHIFSGLVHREYGYDNVGFHLSDQTVTMDFNGVLSQEDVTKIETLANEAINQNLEIQVDFPSNEVLANLAYRSKKEIEGQVRIVTIPGIDRCACCAPHVKRTGEVGILKIMSVQNYKGGVRISILCGFRALEEYRKKQAIIAELMSQLSTNQDAIIESINKLKNQNQMLKANVIAAKQELMDHKLSAMEEQQENVYLFEQELDAQVMRYVVNRLVKEHSGYCGIFVGNDQDGYRYLVGSREGDARTVAVKLKEAFHAKGGGSAAMIQGSVSTTRAELELCLK